MIRNLLALTGLISLALVSAVTLQARGYFNDFYDDGPPAREAVSTRGLDLASPEGVRELEGRINRAIDRICSDTGGSVLRAQQAISTCRENAIAGVGPQVDRAVAAAQEQQYIAYREPPRWRGEPPPQPYAMPAPEPEQSWRGEDERRWRADRAEFHWRSGERAPVATPVGSEPAVGRPPAPPPGPTLGHGRLIKRTVVTTTVTTTTSRGGMLNPPLVKQTVAVKHAAASKWQRKPMRSTARSQAYARRPAVAGSWLPPVAWTASERATRSAFRTGRPVRWHLTDRDGIARAGHVSVGAARWRGGCACREVQTVKYHGGRQIVVASGMRCLAGKRLVNRAA